VLEGTARRRASVRTNLRTSTASEPSRSSSPEDGLSRPGWNGRYGQAMDRVEGLVRDNRVEVRVLFGASSEGPASAGLLSFMGPPLRRERCTFVATAPGKWCTAVCTTVHHRARAEPAAAGSAGSRPLSPRACGQRTIWRDPDGYDRRVTRSAAWRVTCSSSNGSPAGCERHDALAAEICEHRRVLPGRALFQQLRANLSNPARTELPSTSKSGHTPRRISRSRTQRRRHEMSPTFRVGILGSWRL
jgi:hypothetical protein